MKKNLALLSLLLLAACASPITSSPQGSNPQIAQETQRERELAYKTMMRDEDRVFDVSFPLLAANTEFCKKTKYSQGFTVWNLPLVKDGYSQAAQNLYNLHNRLAVQHIATNGPAYKAGLRSGDIIVAVNGQEVERGYNAKKIFEKLLPDGKDPVEFTLERDGKAFTKTVTPLRVCGYSVEYDPNSADVNAAANGTAIYLTRGIVRFTEDDHELALVIAHELGHNAMSHIDKKEGNSLLGGLGGVAVDAVLAGAGVNTGGGFSRMGQQLGGTAYSVQFEQEADYVGMYFMERAGYNTTGVGDFWRRFAAETPQTIDNRSSHPTSPERFIAIEATHKEIAKKKAAGEKLVPNFKKDQAAAE